MADLQTIMDSSIKYTGAAHGNPETVYTVRMTIVSSHFRYFEENKRTNPSFGRKSVLLTRKFIHKFRSRNQFR